MLTKEEIDSLWQRAIRDDAWQTEVNYDRYSSRMGVRLTHSDTEEDSGYRARKMDRIIWKILIHGNQWN